MLVGSTSASIVTLRGSPTLDHPPFLKMACKLDNGLLHQSPYTLQIRQVGHHNCCRLSLAITPAIPAENGSADIHYLLYNCCTAGLVPVGSHTPLQQPQQMPRQAALRRRL